MSEVPPAAAPVNKSMKWVLLVIVLSLAWYLLADRFTPYTQQARLQAYVVPVSAEVAGQVKRVAVGNNQEVRKGEVLFELDQEQYRIALARAEADFDTVGRQIGAHTAGIDSEPKRPSTGGPNAGAPPSIPRGFFSAPTASATSTMPLRTAIVASRLFAPAKSSTMPSTTICRKFAGVPSLIRVT